MRLLAKQDTAVRLRSPACMTKHILKIVGISTGAFLVAIVLLTMIFSGQLVFPPPEACADPPLITAVFLVEGTEFIFRPAELRVQSCQKVRLTFRNTGDDSHRFKIDSVADTGDIHPEVSRTIEFSAPERKGAYPFYDPTSNYRQIGMEGQFIVE